jgi:hypothetical protein
VTWLLNFLTGGLLDKILAAFTTTVTTVASVDRAKIGAATSVTLGEQAATVALSQSAAAMAIADKGWWVTAWMKPVAFYTFMTHCGAFVIDKTFKLGWAIPQLPAPYDAMEHDIILLCLGIVGFKGVARIFSR